jgi:hypothetical protein
MRIWIRDEDLDRDEETDRDEGLGSGMRDLDKR